MSKNNGTRLKPEHRKRLILDAATTLAVTIGL